MLSLLGIRNNSVQCGYLLSHSSVSSQILEELTFSDAQIVRSSGARALGYQTSLLERLMTTTPQYDQTRLEYRGASYTKLVQNYRNHKAILDIPNAEFYSTELKVCATPSITGSLERWDGWPKKEFPIIFHSVRGGDEREGSSPSFFNVAEISIIRTYVESLRKSRNVKVLDSDIGASVGHSRRRSLLR